MEASSFWASPPDKPETGYGYIHQSGAAGAQGEYTVAQAYLAGGQHTWNSGMFVLRDSTWLKALQRFRPTEVETLLGDPSKAKAKPGWTPEITVQQMCAEMVAADLEEAKKHALL
jgi:mannose-1-phosphate guanylyltransferase